ISKNDALRPKERIAKKNKGNKIIGMRQGQHHLLKRTQRPTEGLNKQWIVMQLNIRPCLRATFITFRRTSRTSHTILSPILEQCFHKRQRRKPSDNLQLAKIIDPVQVNS